jgi:hypothetical protein
MRMPPLAMTLLGSAAAWLIVFVAVPPAEQNFPLNDDWAFARGAMLFAQGQGIYYSHWATMPQLGQWVWAFPFLQVLGESHVALRVSTLLLSWLGLVAFYDLLRREGGYTAGYAAFLTAVLAFNPLFFLLQGTFMTDVPALSLSLIGLAFYDRALQDGSRLVLAAACAVALLAVTTRQTAVAVPLVGGFLLWRRPELRRRVLWNGAIVLPVAVGICMHLWMQSRPDVMKAQPAFLPSILALSLPYLIVHLVGLAALPILALGPWPKSWKAIGLVGLILGAIALGLMQVADFPRYGGLFPYIGNMLTPWGAFANSVYPGQRPVLMGVKLRLGLTLLGCVAGAAWLARQWERGRSGLVVGPLLLFSILQVPGIVFAPSYYDRYLLVLLPGGLCLAGSHAAPLRMGWIKGMAVLLIIGGVSVALMRDWLAWNAARWELGRQAVEDGGIEPTDIEGGFEWNGWFAPIAPLASSTPQTESGMTLPFTRQYFPHVTGRFLLTFSELPGTRLKAAEAYSLWLSPGRRQFLLVEVTSSPKPDPAP